MSSTEQLRAPQRARPTLAGRLAGTAIAAGFIAIGVVLATRPVGDEALGAHATAYAPGWVDSTRTTWDGAQLLNVGWTATSNLTGGPEEMSTQLEAANASPPWQGTDEVDLVYDPAHPADAVFEDPTWAYNADYRVSAAIQSAVPFSFAALAVALLVLWPSRPSKAFAARLTQAARRSLQRYVLIPAVISSIPVAAAFVLQYQRLAAYSPGSGACSPSWTTRSIGPPSLLPRLAADYKSIPIHWTAASQPITTAPLFAWWR